MDDETTPPLIACTEWRLRVNYVRGDGRQDIGIPHAAGCGGSRAGVSVNDDTCTSDIQIYDAASQAELSATERRGIPLRVTRDGHRIAYFSKKSMQFVAWDLPSAQFIAISPRLNAQGLDDLRDLEVSQDGRFFAVAFAGDEPRTLLTDFTTGKTVTFAGFCDVRGVSNGATRIAAHQACPDDEGVTSAESGVVIIGRDGTALGTWKSSGFASDLSPDGRLLVAINANSGEDGAEYLVTHDALTGKVVRKLKLRLLSEPSEAIGYAWLNHKEYIVEAEPPEPGGSFGFYRVDVRSGKSKRIRDLGLDPGGEISLGSVFVKNQS